MKKDFEQNIQSLYSTLRTEWLQYQPLWQEIAKYVGISVDVNYIDNRGQNTRSNELDIYIDDPSATLAVNQAGDYLRGIMWGTGEKVFDLVPSRYVTDLIEAGLVEDFYSYATDQALYHMNHPDAGLSVAMQSYAYDQFSFGTSGIGVFPNPDFDEGIDENALIFRNYGIDNTMIMEGKSGQPEIVICVYNWETNRIISEFAKTNGEFDKEKFEKLPKQIRECWSAKKLNDKFKLVFCCYPRENFDPKLKGKRGARYKGVWFLDSDGDNSIFHEEDFQERPVAMTRAVKVRGEAYGRASGTSLLQTIKSVNFMVSSAIETIDKMNNPSLGMYNNSLFGDSVLDTSPNGMVVFNSTSAMGSGGSPIFPIHDVGDPTPIINFLVPYLNEKITTGFKVDSLLDFSSSKEMTATESLQRYNIRGKSLSGFLQQQKDEGLSIFTRRAVSLLLLKGQLGVDPRSEPEMAKNLKARRMNNKIIPEAVLQVMDMGRPWYELKFNNELEKLTKTETIQSLLQFIQSIGAVASLYPQIISAINWHKLLKDVNDNLDYNSQLMITESEFKAQIEAEAQRQQQMMDMQMGITGAQVNKDMAQANKANREANNAK